MEPNFFCTIIVGYNRNNTNGSLLLCRFNNLQPKISKRKKESVTNLLSDLLKQIDNGGYERRRIGGSSGLIGNSPYLKDLLRIRDSSPRISSGTVFLMSSNRLKLHVMYISTRDGDLKYTYYTNPQRGGSFRMSTGVLKKYNFLLDFASTKPLAGLIMYELFNRKKSLHPTVKSVSSVACQEELRNLEYVRFFLSQFVHKHSGKDISEEDKLSLFYDYYSSKFLNYTLVMHPVGRHYDSFVDKKSSLENRVCFFYRKDAI